jgi:Icc-related predicted phosphoesterase
MPAGASFVGRTVLSGGDRICGPSPSSSEDVEIRILLISDLHYSLPQFDWVVKAASDFDLVVMAGDQLNIASSAPIDAQVLVVLKYLDLLHAEGRIVVSSGNHDLTGPGANGEQTATWMADVRARGIACDGDSLLIGDTLFTICPWWDGPQDRLAVHEQLARDARRRPARWVWVYHWPPTDSPTSWTGRRHYGDEELSKWITQHSPDIVLSGHVHQPPFRPDGSWADRIGSTWVFNPGNQIGPVPSFIELDLNTDQVTWSSMLGQEQLNLADPAVPSRTVF